MSSAPDRYYRPAGTVPFVGTVLMLVLGCLGAVVFSFFYALILNYVPYDKIMFLGAMVLGCGAGGFVRGGALMGGVTSRAFTALVGVCCGLLACHLMWVWDIWMLFDWNLQALNFNPLRVLDALIFFNDQGGIWQDSPTGIWLWLLWLAEVLMITGISVGMTLIPFRPFCHACNKWTQELPTKTALPRSDLSELRVNLEEERYETLDRLGQAEIDPASHYELSLVKCPGCSDSDYLTVAEVDVAVNKKGETAVKRKEVIRHLHVPEEVVDQIVTLATRQQGPSVKDLDFGKGPATEARPDIASEEQA